MPREFSAGNGWFAVNAATKVHYSGGAGAAEAANYFIEQAKHNPEIVLAAASEGAAASKDISFEITPADQSLAGRGLCARRFAGWRARDGAHARGTLLWRSDPVAIAHGISAAKRRGADPRHADQ